MNILHISHFGKLGVSGIATVVESLSFEQQELGHKVTIGLISPIEKNNYKVPVININEDFSKTILSLNIDIVIFHSVFYKQYLRYYRILKKMHIPYIITMHGSGSQVNMKKNSLKKKIALYMFFNKFLKNASALSFLSKKEYERNQLLSLCPNSIILPNGIEGLNVKTNHSKKSIRIIYLGRISYYDKGLDLLLDSFEIIKNKFKNIDCNFTFYGPKYNNSIDHDLLPYKDFAVWHDSVSGKDKEYVYRNSDIFILTSRTEGMPMGVLEALSYGLPCIVTPQTNMSDLISNNDAGWVTELNSEQIANTILYAISDYKKRSVELSNNAISAVSSFTWKKIAKLSIDQYISILRR